MAQRNGVGRVVSANATGVSITLSGARKISVVNAAASANTVWVQVDDTLAALLVTVAAGTAIPIPPGGSWTFAEGNTQTYNTVQIACATGETATAYMASN